MNAWNASNGWVDPVVYDESYLTVSESDGILVPDSLAGMAGATRSNFPVDLTPSKVIAGTKETLTFR